VDKARAPVNSGRKKKDLSSQMMTFVYEQSELLFQSQAPPSRLLFLSVLLHPSFKSVSMFPYRFQAECPADRNPPDMALCST
jgi:hypothetical protein